MFHEDWYADDACLELGRLASWTNGLPGGVLEVGCWEGKSTVAIANAVGDRVRAVDTWEGSPGEVSSIIATERNVYAEFRQNIKDMTGGNVDPFRTSWRTYFETHRDPLRFCHIDATHTYQEVRDNIETVLPLMVEGGIICGDDVHHEPVARAVDEMLGPFMQTGPIWYVPIVPEHIRANFLKNARTPSDIFEHLPTMVGLAHLTNARTVIELGTRSGVSTAAWVYALWKKGHVWSVDIDDPPAVDAENWSFVKGDDLDLDVYKQLPDDADIVFVDTSHAYKQTVAELNLYRWKIKSGGKIVLHDTELAQPYGLRNQPPFPVKKAVVEFCADEGLEWTNHTNCNGLGVISIP